MHWMIPPPVPFPDDTKIHWTTWPSLPVDCIFPHPPPPRPPLPFEVKPPSVGITANVKRSQFPSFSQFTNRKELIGNTLMVPRPCKQGVCGVTVESDHIGADEEEKESLEIDVVDVEEEEGSEGEFVYGFVLSEDWKNRLKPTIQRMKQQRRKERYGQRGKKAFMPSKPYGPDSIWRCKIQKNEPEDLQVLKNAVESEASLVLKSMEASFSAGMNRFLQDNYSDFWPAVPFQRPSVGYM